MWQIVFVAVGHLLILFLALLGLRLLHRYTASRFIHSGIHCPTQLAAKGQYEPPRGWMVLHLIVHLIIPRPIFLTATIGSFLILLYDFGFRSTIATWFSKPGWEWKLPVVLAIGVLINLIVTVERLCSKAIQKRLSDRSRCRSKTSDRSGRTDKRSKSGTCSASVQRSVSGIRGERETGLLIYEILFRLTLLVNLFPYCRGKLFNNPHEITKDLGERE
jgi:hypothetical protein